MFVINSDSDGEQYAVVSLAALNLKEECCIFLLLYVVLKIYRLYMLYIYMLYML